jgi:CRP/FNR family transcriptional regulator, cyclic AMP receptor protein
MSTTPAGLPTLCHLLDEDSDLAEAVPSDRRQRAARECLARTVVIPAGRWRGMRTAALGEGIGLLVLGGLLIRRVGLDARFGAELLG